MKRLIRAEDEKELFLQECREKNFSIVQLSEIEYGLDRLSLEDVKFYAKKRYKSSKMRLFRNCLIRNISKDDILQYFDKNFDKDQVSIIVWSFDNLPLEKIKLFLDPDFNSRQMLEIAKGLRDLSLEEVKLYLNKDFNPHQMSQIYIAFKRYKLSIEEVKTFAKPEYNSWELANISNAIVSLKPEPDKLDFYLDCLKKNFTQYQLNQVIEGLKTLSIEDVKIYAKKKYSSFAMNRTRDALTELEPDKLDFYLDCLENNFDGYQLQEIIEGLKTLSIEDVKIYAKKEYDNDSMIIFRYDLEHNISKEKINSLIDIYNDSNWHNDSNPNLKLGLINNIILEGLNVNFAKFIVDSNYSNMAMIQEKLIKLKSKLNNLSNNEIDQIFNPNFTFKQKLNILKCFELNIPVKEILKFVNGKEEMNNMIYNYFNNSDNFEDDEDGFENDE